MLKTFTRGGQVTLHNLRMIRQVISVTLLVTLMLGGCVFCLKSWFDYTPYERSAALSYFWADFKLGFPLIKDETRMKMTQRYTYKDGSKGIVRALDIVDDPWHQELEERIRNQLAHNAILSAWWMLAFFGLVCGGWIWRGKRTKQKKILSGSRIVEPRTLQHLLEKQKVASSFKIGGVSLRLGSETQHLLFAGTTGTGKSNCFTGLIPQIRQAGQRAIIVDTTGEFVSRFYREGTDILINPFDARSVGWNPWAECLFPYHYDELVQGFIPQTGYDRFWSDAARTVFSEALMYLNDKGERTIEKLLNILLTCSLNDLYKTFRFTPAASLLDPTGDKTAMSIRSHLTPYLKMLKYLPKGKPAFSVREWVSGSGSQNFGQGWVFIVSTPDQRDTLKPFLTGLITIAFNPLGLNSPPLAA